MSERAIVKEQSQHTDMNVAPEALLSEGDSFIPTYYLNSCGHKEGYRLQRFPTGSYHQLRCPLYPRECELRGKNRKIAKDQTALRGREQLEQPILDKGILISQRRI